MSINYIDQKLDTDGTSSTDECIIYTAIFAF